MKYTYFGKTTVATPNEPLIDAPDAEPSVNWTAIGAVDVATAEKFLCDVVRAVAFAKGQPPLSLLAEVAGHLYIEDESESAGVEDSPMPAAEANTWVKIS